MDIFEIIITLFYFFLLLVFEWMFFRWAFKKKGLLKIVGLFYTIPGQEHLFSFFKSVGAGPDDPQT